MPTFQYYSSANSYAEPYSSSTNGGELISEFNQRAQLNVLGYKQVNLKYSALGEDITFTAKLTGCKTQSDLQLSIVGSNLTIHEGEALIAGYYVDLMEELVIPTSSIIPKSEMPTNVEDDYLESRYVKIAVITTQAVGNPHDERLVPPVGDTYMGIAVVIDNIVPTENQLLLGRITRDVNGAFAVVNNDFKTRLLPIDKISGAENYSDLVRSPEEGDENVYGIQYTGTDGGELAPHLININEWTWLRYSSVLGRFLRNFAKVPDAAGVMVKDGQDDPNLEMLGTMVGWNYRTGIPDPYHRGPYADGTNTSTNKLIRLRNYDYTVPSGQDQATPFLAYRVLKDGQNSSDDYDMEYVPLPFASYSGMPVLEGSSLSSRRSGIVTAETKWQVDQLWTDRDSMNMGTQYGPFLTYTDAQAWLDTALKGYWRSSNHIMYAHYDRTTGTYSDPMDNRVGQLYYAINFNCYFRYNPTKQYYELALNDYFWVLNDTTSNIAGVTSEGDIITDYGTISSTYTARTSGDVTISANDIPLTGATAGDLSGTFSGTLTVRIGNETQTGEATGTLDLDDGYIAFNDSTVSFNDVLGTVSGTGSGVATFTLDSFTQNVSARYVYLPTKSSQSDIYIDPQVKPEWKKQAVLRGFACPATTTRYGFVRPSSGAEIGDVINDPDSNQLRVSDATILMIQNGGWKYSSETLIQLTADNTNKFAEIENTYFVNDCTIKLTGDGWDASAVPALHRIRGNITLDISSVAATDEDPSIILCHDIDELTLVTGATLNERLAYTGKIDVKDCVITPHNFLNIRSWKGSRFTSGSNTATLDNPWVTVEDVFTDSGIENILQSRIVSVTMGESGVSSAEMDVWIKYADFTKPIVSDNISWVSTKELKFPPLQLTLDDSGNPSELIPIPDYLNAKIAGTGGKHESWQSQGDLYVTTGNWICTIDWENGEVLSVNGRMLSPTSDRIHGIYDLRFRASIQFMLAADPVVSQISYAALEELY